MHTGGFQGSNLLSGGFQSSSLLSSLPSSITITMDVEEDCRLCRSHRLDPDLYYNGRGGGLPLMPVPSTSTRPRPWTTRPANENPLCRLCRVAIRREKVRAVRLERDVDKLLHQLQSKFTEEIWKCIEAFVDADYFHCDLQIL